MMGDPLCICGCRRSFHKREFEDNATFSACSGTMPSGRSCSCKRFRLALGQVLEGGREDHRAAVDSETDRCVKAVFDDNRIPGEFQIRARDAIRR